MRQAVWAAVAAVVVAFVALAVVAAVGELGDRPFDVSPGFIALAIAALLALQAIQGELWRVVLSDLGVKVDRWRSQALWARSVLGRYAPTSALMPMMRMAFFAREGVPRRVVFSAVLYEVVLALLGAVAVGAWFILEQPSFERGGLRYVAIALPIAGLIVVHPKIFRPLANWALRKAGREELDRALPERQLFSLAFLYAASFVVGGVAVYALAHLFAPVSDGDVPSLVGSFAVGYLIAVVGFISPAGLGVREAGLTFVLAPALGTGPAVATAVALRLAQIVAELIYAGATSLIAKRLSPRAHEPEPARTPDLSTAS